MAKYINTCTYCGAQFTVDSLSKHDPTNQRKFKRACSEECTRKLKSDNMKRNHDGGKFNYKTGQRRYLDRDVLIRLYCYEYKTVAEIAKELRTKQITVTREMRRLDIPHVFYRTCPQCGEIYGNQNRSQCLDTSNKFKKFCSRKCFLSSRRQCDTWIERVIAEFLTGLGVDYGSQVPLNRMTVDFVVGNIVIEANGDFWHANPSIYGKEKPLHRIHERVIAKDRRKVAQLRELGYDVLVVWENDLKTDLDGTLKRMQAQIESRTKGVA